MNSSMIIKFSNMNMETYRIEAPVNNHGKVEHEILAIPPTTVDFATWTTWIKTSNKIVS